jgi:hypothetical protein
MDFNLFPGGKPPDKPPAAGNAPPPGGEPPEAPVTVYRYRCTEACTFQKRYRKEGDIIELPEKPDTLPHFESLGV